MNLSFCAAKVLLFFEMCKLFLCYMQEIIQKAEEEGVIEEDHGAADGDVNGATRQVLYPFDGVIHGPGQCPGDFADK